MARLQTLWVLHTTSMKEDAGTDDGFELQIRSPINASAVAGTFRFPDLPHDERERGRTDEYRFDVSGIGIDMFGIGEDNICIRTLGADAWLPGSIWVIGQDAQGTRQLLASVPDWPDDLWFSKDPSEGAPPRCLDAPRALFNPASAS